MGTYATGAEVNAYIEGGSGYADADATLERHIQRAQRDVDRAAGVWVVDRTTGLKFTPSAMGAVPRAALMRATAAQVEYRLAKGEAFFMEEPMAVQGPDFSSQYREPRIGPKVYEELQLGGLRRVTARVK